MSTMVELTFTGGKKIEAKIEEHVIRVDQSVEDGGEGTAPDPAQHFLTSLASCAGTNLLYFCASRKIPTEGIAYRVHCEYDPGERRYTKLKTEVTLPEGFPDKYRPALTRAMDLCFVKKHLLIPPAFETVLR